MAGNKILAAPSGQNTAPAGTEALPLTGSQYILISTLVAFALASPVITGHPTIEGVTSTGATGTGRVVFQTSPSLVTPVLGVATATSINKVALTAPATSATLTIADGKTLTASNSLTLAGTDATTQTFPTTSATIARTDAAQTFTGVQTFSTPIAASSVATMTATVGGGVPTPPNNTTTFLRGDGTFAAPPGGALTVGTTTIASGTSTRILYDNAGVLGEYTLTGTGTVAVMQTSPSLITPAVGVATGTSLALGGATIGTDALGVTGTATVSGKLTAASYAISTDWLIARGNPGILQFSANNASSTATAISLTDTVGGPTGSNIFSFGVSPTLNSQFSGSRASTCNMASIVAGQTTATTFDFCFWIGGSGGRFEAITLKGGTGFVGISVTAPTSMLQVGGTLTVGNIASATPAARIVQIGENSRGGTDTNTAGSSGTIENGLGTGNAADPGLILRTTTPRGTSDSTAQVFGTRLTLTNINGTFTVPVAKPSYLTANLPTGIAAYSEAYVTDSTTTVITGLGLAPTGGGANKVPVYTTDGTNWLIG